MTKRKKAHACVSFEKTARNILYFLENTDMTAEARTKLEEMFKKFTSVTISEQNRWDRYVKTEKATSHAR